ncbi:hypothetical protein [Sinorhizobium sojae]|uniref:hypothetical protein n=1 Tax=Sinorhizobium sojae TaxID=716925 RepID=UPI0012FDFE79|nr:hypothetical protein [Sinorhizobium sojae]
MSEGEKNSDSCDHEESEKCGKGDEFRFGAAFPGAGNSDGAGAAALLLHGFLSLTLGWQAPACHALHGATILLLRKVHEMETVRFPFASHSASAAFAAMKTRFGHFH